MNNEESSTNIQVHRHADGTEHSHAASHTHSPEEYHKLIHRTSIIIGHVSSIKKMLEEERDCTDILIQISAVQSSLNNLGKLILKNHISECILNAGELQDPVERDNAFDDLNEAIDKFIR